jgi:hypothetical protein
MSPLPRTLFVRARTNPNVGVLDRSKGYYTGEAEKRQPLWVGTFLLSERDSVANTFGSRKALRS